MILHSFHQNPKPARQVAAPEPSREQDNKSTKKEKSKQNNPHQKAITKSFNDFVASSMGRSVPGDSSIHPMQRWLEEDKSKEPFHGFDDARLDHAIYQPAGGLQHKHAIADSVDAEAGSQGRLTQIH